MDQEVAIIGEHPFGLVMTLHAAGQFARVFELQADFLANSLHLFGIVAGANDEVIGERCDAGQIQNLDVFGLFRFSGAYRNEP
jgi:hypothetical protein